MDVKSPRFLDNQLTDGDEIVTLYSKGDSWSSCLLEAESILGP
jgi:hypothetical protein